MSFTESTYENAVIQLFEGMGLGGCIAQVTALPAINYAS